MLATYSAQCAPARHNKQGYIFKVLCREAPEHIFERGFRLGAIDCCKYLSNLLKDTLQVYRQLHK